MKDLMLNILDKEAYSLRAKMVDNNTKLVVFSAEKRSVKFY
jgi:hypothetical protein